MTCCGGKFPFDQRTLIATRAEDLNALLRTSGRFDAVLLRIDAMPEDERTRWQQRLLSAYTECGCDAGGIALLIALVAVTLSAFSADPPSWIAGIGGVFGAALGGKALGILLARLRLWRDVRLIRVYTA